MKRFFCCPAVVSMRIIVASHTCTVTHYAALQGTVIVHFGKLLFGMLI